MDSDLHHTATAGRLSRSQRAPAALATDHFRLDERGIAEMLDTATGLARLLTYFDADNRPHPPPGDTGPLPGPPGAWESFFYHDVTFLLAEIAATDPEHDYRVSRAAEDADLARRIVAEAGRIWRWQDRARELSALAGPGEVAVDLVHTLEQADRGDLKGAVFDDLRALVMTDDTAAIARWSPPRSRGTVRDTMGQLYSTVNRATAQIRVAARTYLRRALAERRDHPAHLGLFLAFVTLLRKSQADLNRMTDRHLDFYFREVLRSAPRGPQPDTGFVTFQLAPGAAPVDLEAGTALVAGSGAGPGAGIFTTDHALRVTPARIASLGALAVARTPRWRDRQGAPYVEGVNSYPVAASRDGQGAALTDPAEGWSPLGPTRDAPAEIGFALAAPVLDLAGGTRRIRVLLDFAPDGTFTLAKALRDYRAVLADRSEGAMTDARFARFLSEAVQVSLSTAAGPFHRAGEVRLTPDPERADRLEIAVTLAATDPAIAAHPPLHPHPLLKVALNPGARAYAYSPLQRLRLRAVEIAVEVTDLRALTLETDLAPVPPGKPFAPFGPLPLPGAGLTVRAAELARKSPEWLALTLDWSHLPLPPDSFAETYAAYGGKIGTDSFRARLSRSDGSAWQALPVQGPGDARPAPQPALFASDADGSVRTRTCWQVPDLPAADADAATPPRPGNSRVQPPPGSLRIELTAPQMGFGHRLYPQLVAEAALARSAGLLARILAVIAPKSAAAALQGPPLMPKPPLLPMMTGVALSYGARSRATGLDAGDGIEMFTLGLLGPMTRTSQRQLVVPDLNLDGALRIGLADAAPSETVSLLFDIRDSLAAGWRPGDPEPRPGVAWRYLSPAGWRPLPPGALRAETTQGLTTRGRVEIALPADAQPDAGTPGAPLVWLSADLTGDRRRFGRIRSIATQAAQVTRRIPPGPGAAPAAPPEPLPAGAITRFLAARPAIAKVVQPVPTQGGRAAETDADFRVRLSERLGHKARALRPMDYARLVLEAFDDIGDVRCLATGGTDGREGGAGPGGNRVELIVAPRRVPGQTDRFPRVPLARRAEIAAWLAARCALPVQTIDVRNPIYEEIRVQACLVSDPEGPDLPLSRVLRHLSELIAPWAAEPAQPMPIGAARLDVARLAHHLAGCPGVADVLGLSVVQFYRARSPTQGAEGRYGFKDSARLQPAPGVPAGAVMIGATPASVFVPARYQPISVLGPRRGIGDLSVGADFLAADPRRVPGYRADPGSLPRAPTPVGIGTLTIGETLVLTAPEDTRPSSYAPAIPDHGIDTVFLAD